MLDDFPRHPGVPVDVDDDADDDADADDDDDVARVCGVRALVTAPPLYGIQYSNQNPRGNGRRRGIRAVYALGTGEGG